jgi:hypothetical protein
MGKTLDLDRSPNPPDASKRTRGELLRDIKLALATGSNYGRGARQQGFNPYDSQLGRTPRDLWGRRAK